jgi:glycosyltransferase involved in cell wall biosynthesis
VSLTGLATGDQVRRALAEARVFVLPSFAEGLPVVIMEAMALGVPVIATYIAGIPELVIDGVTGWLVPAGDEDGLALAIRRALDCPDERLTEMGRAARARVAERHDADREAAKLAQLFGMPGDAA